MKENFYNISFYLTIKITVHRFQMILKSIVKYGLEIHQMRFAGLII